jgi:hypothetical protein
MPLLRDILWNQELEKFQSVRSDGSWSLGWYHVTFLISLHDTALMREINIQARLLLYLEDR